MCFAKECRISAKKLQKYCTKKLWFPRKNCTQEKLLMLDDNYMYISRDFHAGSKKFAKFWSSFNFSFARNIVSQFFCAELCTVCARFRKVPLKSLRIKHANLHILCESLLPLETPFDHWSLIDHKPLRILKISLRYSIKNGQLFNETLFKARTFSQIYSEE